MFQTGLRLLNMAEDSPSLALIASHGDPSAVMMVPRYLYLWTCGTWWPSLRIMDGGLWVQKHGICTVFRRFI